MCSSWRFALGEKAEERCSTQEEDDVRMERGCGDIGDSEANLSLR